MDLYDNVHDIRAYLLLYPFQDVPSIYFPFNFRRNIKFRSLARHIFTSVEKTWICDFIVKNGVMSSYKGVVLPEMVSRTLLVGIISWKYDLQHEMLAWWLEVHGRGVQFVENSTITIIDEVGMHSIMLLWNDIDSVPSFTQLDDLKIIFDREKLLSPARRMEVMCKARRTWSEVVVYLSRL